MYEVVHCANDFLREYMILIDGKKIAAELREELRQEVIELKAFNSMTSCLSSSLSSAAIFFPSIKIMYSLKKSLAQCTTSYTFL